MELPKRNPNRIRGFDYSQNGAYFVTICTQNRQRILSKIVGTPVPGCPQAPCPELLSYGKIADKYIRQMDTFYDHLSVDNYVTMPDHIHIIIWLDNGSMWASTPRAQKSSIIGCPIFCVLSRFLRHKKLEPYDLGLKYCRHTPTERMMSPVQSLKHKKKHPLSTGQRLFLLGEINPLRDL